MSRQCGALRAIAREKQYIIGMLVNFFIIRDVDMGNMFGIKIFSLREASLFVWGQIL